MSPTFVGMRASRSAAAGLSAASDAPGSSESAAPRSPDANGGGGVVAPPAAPGSPDASGVGGVVAPPSPPSALANADASWSTSPMLASPDAARYTTILS